MNFVISVVLWKHLQTDVMFLSWCELQLQITGM